MLIGQQVLVVQVVEEVARRHLAILVGYQNHVAAALNQVDALSAKGRRERPPHPLIFADFS